MVLFLVRGGGYGQKIASRSRCVVGGNGRETGLDFRILAESLPHLVWFTRADGVADYFNARILSYLGRMPEAMQKWAWAEALHPEDRQRSLAAWATALRLGSDFAAEHRLRRADGCYLWHAARATPLRDADGKIVRWFGTCSDIDAKKQLAGRLQQAENRFRLLTENLPDAFVSVDMEGRLLDFNAAYQQLLGYPADELRRMTYVELTPEKWHATEARLVAGQVLPRGYSEVYEKEYRRRDGSIVPVELRTILSRSAEGEPESMWAIVRDISARKRLQEKLRASEDRFRAFMDHAPSIAWIKDAQLRYVYVSQTYEQRFGLRLADLAGKDDFAFWPPEVAESFRQSDLAAVNSGCSQMRLEEARDYVGNRHAWQVSKFPFRDSRGQLYIGGIGVEMTERLQIEERWHSIMELSPDIISILGADGVLHYNSPAARTIHGYSSEEMVGKKHLELIHPDDRASVEAAVEAIGRESGGIARSVPVPQQGRQL